MLIDFLLYKHSVTLSGRAKDQVSGGVTKSGCVCKEYFQYNLGGKSVKHSKICSSRWKKLKIC
jgi:hypothetical protein